MLGPSQQENAARVGNTPHSVEVQRVRRRYKCVSCSETFLASVPLNVFGDLVGGNCNHPQKCSKCRRGNKRKHRHGETVSQLCTMCDKEFTFTWTGTRRSRCDECRKARPTTSQVKECVVCGDEFQGRGRLYCSQECRGKARYKAQKYKNCPSCGTRRIKDTNSKCRECWRAELEGGVHHRSNQGGLPRIVGEVGEKAVDLLAAWEGWQVYRPQSDNNEAVDRLIDFRDGNGVKTVQIKTKLVVCEWF